MRQRLDTPFQEDCRRCMAHHPRVGDPDPHDDHPAGLGMGRSGSVFWAWRNECVRRNLVRATGCPVPHGISDGYNGLSPPPAGAVSVLRRGTVCQQPH